MLQTRHWPPNTKCTSPRARSLCRREGFHTPCSTHWHFDNFGSWGTLLWNRDSLSERLARFTLWARKMKSHHFPFVCWGFQKFIYEIICLNMQNIFEFFEQVTKYVHIILNSFLILSALLYVLSRFKYLHLLKNKFIWLCWNRSHEKTEKTAY